MIHRRHARRRSGLVGTVDWRLQRSLSPGAPAARARPCSPRLRRLAPSPHLRINHCRVDHVVRADHVIHVDIRRHAPAPTAPHGTTDGCCELRKHTAFVREHGRPRPRTQRRQRQRAIRHQPACRCRTWADEAVQHDRHCDGERLQRGVVQLGRRPASAASARRPRRTRRPDPPDNTGIGPCVDKRAAIGNAAHADAVIAIHADGAPPSGRGFHVIYPPDVGSTAPIYQSSLRLAHAVHDAILGSGLLHLHLPRAGRV